MKMTPERSFRSREVFRRDGHSQSGDSPPRGDHKTPVDSRRRLTTSRQEEVNPAGRNSTRRKVAYNRSFHGEVFRSDGHSQCGSPPHGAHKTPVNSRRRLTRREETPLPVRSHFPRRVHNTYSQTRFLFGLLLATLITLISLTAFHSDFNLSTRRRMPENVKTDSRGRDLAFSCQIFKVKEKNKGIKCIANFYFNGCPNADTILTAMKRMVKPDDHTTCYRFNKFTFVSKNKHSVTVQIDRQDYYASDRSNAGDPKDVMKQYITDVNTLVLHTPTPVTTTVSTHLREPVQVGTPTVGHARVPNKNVAPSTGPKKLSPYKMKKQARIAKTKERIRKNGLPRDEHFFKWFIRNSDNVKFFQVAPPASTNCKAYLKIRQPEKILFLNILLEVKHRDPNFAKNTILAAREWIVPKSQSTENIQTPFRLTGRALPVPNKLNHTYFTISCKVSSNPTVDQLEGFVMEVNRKVSRSSSTSSTTRRPSTSTASTTSTPASARDKQIQAASSTPRDLKNLWKENPNFGNFVSWDWNQPKTPASPVSPLLSYMDLERCEFSDDEKLLNDIGKYSSYKKF